MTSAAESALRDARTAMEKWVETRQLISRTQADWQGGKESLVQTIQLFEREKAGIASQMSMVSTNSQTVEKEYAEAKSSKEALTRGLDKATSLVAGLEAKLRSQAATFPSPLLEKVQPVLDRIPQDATQTKLSAAERIQTVVTLLNEIDKFNGAVTVAAEVQKNPAGTEVQVETLYLGLAQAYFVDKPGEYSGVGTPTLQGWKWEPRSDLAPVIKKALSIYKNASPAAFVSLPVEVR